MITLPKAAEILSHSEELATLLREILTARNMAQAQIAELEAKESNILHEMERPRCLYADRAKLATQLQGILSERRRLKDWLCANKQIWAFMESDKGPNLQGRLDGFIGVARKATSKYGLLPEPFEN